ncbi:MAG: zinc-ribbon domain-containing protein [Erysipelotrichaceae bacterium]|nr:zinc-ribbon domain-containing protein [Erysipelotrichaceae bacterium]
MAKICPKCGTQLRDDDRFCRNCGYALQSEAPKDLLTAYKDAQKKETIPAKHSQKGILILAAAIVLFVAGFLIFSLREKGTTVRFGQDGIGYISLPRSWNDESLEEDGDITLQYSDPNGDYLIVMYSYSDQELKDYGVGGLSADTYLGWIWDDLEESYSDQLEEAYLTKETVSGREADKLITTYNDGTALYAWAFYDEEGTLHYVSAETLTSKDIQEVEGYILNSYGVKK